MAGRLWRFFGFVQKLRAVINYIKNQEEHHRVKTFREEYLEFLKEQEISFDEKHIFEDVN